MKAFAPIAIFAFRRPDHLRKLLESLMQCPEFDKSQIIVYCDGARNKEEETPVLETRRMARDMLGKRAEYHFSEKNQGLSCSVISGVTDVVNRFGRVIVLEDDLELNSSFLGFMNQALDQYAADENVYQVSGYMFDIPELKDVHEALFLPVTVSWGWATWKRAWDLFDPMAQGWEAVKKDKGLRHRFNLDSSYDYATLLVRQMAGLRDSWAIRWYWTVFKAEGLVLFPPVSKVKNTGFDGSGTHGQGLLRRFSKNSETQSKTGIDLPLSVFMDPGLYGLAKKALHRQNGGWVAAIVDRIRRLI